MSLAMRGMQIKTNYLYAMYLKTLLLLPNGSLHKHLFISTEVKDLKKRKALLQNRDKMRETSKIS